MSATLLQCVHVGVKLGVYPEHDTREGQETSSTRQMMATMGRQLEQIDERCVKRVKDVNEQRK